VQASPPEARTEIAAPPSSTIAERGTRGESSTGSSAGSTAASLGLSDETALLRDAHAELENGDAARALAILDQHAQRFPRAVLTEEREAERIFAFCALGRQSEASERGRRFLLDHARSPLAARVRSSCATK
jgi:RNA polymerase sigma-70 factor (ECF subfamily)